MIPQDQPLDSNPSEEKAVPQNAIIKTERAPRWPYWPRAYSCIGLANDWDGPAIYAGRPPVRPTE